MFLFEWSVGKLLNFGRIVELIGGNYSLGLNLIIIRFGVIMVIIGFIWWVKFIRKMLSGGNNL